MRKFVAASAFALVRTFLILPFAASASYAQQYHILQRPALTQTAIVFNYAGDLWTVDRKGGRAVRLTTGVGIETSPIVSPDGQTIASPASTTATQTSSPSPSRAASRTA